MTIPTGGIAKDDSFFDREKDRKNLWRQLKKDHVMLFGPRRLGKSSLLSHMVGVEAKDQGYPAAALIDLERCASVRAALEAIDAEFPAEEVKALWKKVVGQVKAARPKIEKGPLSLDLNDPQAPAWADLANGLCARLIDKPVLICLDEFPVFLEKLLKADKAEAEYFCRWLRDFRSRASACRFIFSGSIGINSLLTRHNLTTHFNDPHYYRLEAFSRKAALEMLNIQSEKEGWHLPRRAAEKICDRIGWLTPYYLNLMLLESVRSAEDREDEEGEGKKTLLEEDVENAYSRLLASRPRFTHWHQRLEDSLAEPERGLAKEILAIAAQSEAGLSREQLKRRLKFKGRAKPDFPGLMARVFQFLEDDGYLSAEEPIRFLSFPLRDYWKRNHV